MKRLEFLDGLRGLAALYVAMMHAPLIISPKLIIPELIKPVLGYGWTGVELFFIVSGFSLTMTMPSHYKSDRPMVSYAISRLSRIAPLFYVLIIHAIAVKWFLHGETFDVDKIVKSALFVFNMFPADVGGVVGASWTIGTEMLFYAAFPLVYLVAKDVWRSLAIAIGSIIISAAFFRIMAAINGGPETLFHYSNVSVITHFSTFVFGIAAYHAVNALSAYGQRDSLGHFLTAAGLAGILWLAMNPYALPLHPGQSPSFFYVLIVVGLGLAPWRIIVNKVTRFYGRICYSVYLWHPPIIFALEPLLHKTKTLGYGDGVTLLICYSIVLPAITVAGTASYYLIEIPGLQLGQQIKKAIGAHRSNGG